MNEAETRAEHIDPALRAAGWGVVEGSRGGTLRWRSDCILLRWFVCGADFAVVGNAMNHYNEDTLVQQAAVQYLFSLLCAVKRKMIRVHLI